MKTDALFSAAPGNPADANLRNYLIYALGRDGSNVIIGDKVFKLGELLLAAIKLGNANLGEVLFNVAVPGAVRYLRINADNTITLRTAAELLDDLAGGIYPTTAASYNNQTGTTYTLQASDNGKIVTFNNASAITVTVPAALGATFQCLCIQKGAGQVTFTASGVTLNNVYGLNKIVGQSGRASIIAEAANVLNLGGDLI